MLTTPSECARQARAELEVIIASLQLSELARLLQLGRQILDEQRDAGDNTTPGSDRLFAREPA